MRSATTTRRGPSAWSSFFLVLLVLVVGLVGGVLTLAAFGIVDLGELFRPKQVMAEERPEGVPVLISARPIPAYTSIAAEHVIDPKTSNYTVIYSKGLTPQQIADSGLIADASSGEPAVCIDRALAKMLGRVLKRDKPQGVVFKESDFMPVGTRPGTVAGIPAGKRAFALDVDKVQGIVYLNPGDHFDLMAAWSVDVQKALTPPSGRAGTATSPSPELHAQVHSQPKRAGVKRLVHDGIVVSGPKQVSRSPRRTGGRPAPEREMMIAVNPDEVAPLLEALATDAEVSCVARSGRTDDPGTSVIPESNPVPPVRAIEQLLGNRRSTTAFPVQGAAPTPEK